MISPLEKAQLIRDKYDGNQDADLTGDLARLAAGEPLAYVIGWVPFHGLRIRLDSHPLIPRPETEFWTESLIAHLKIRFGDTPFRFLDLCAGSGAIGLAILAKFPAVHVSFGELIEPHAELIRLNLKENGLDASRADIRAGDLFAPFKDERFDIIAANPPYIPQERVLDPSVSDYEPPEALFSGSDGLDLIRRIAKEASAHLLPKGELWMESDAGNADEAIPLVVSGGASNVDIVMDAYGRPRLVVGYYP